MSESEPSPPRVFVSYTHDSEEHRKRVLALADRLTNEGVDCHLDRYYEMPSPAEGWPLWMERQVEQADFVLVVCTQTYLQRFRREEAAGKGLGAQWEGAAITQHLYNAAANNTKFIPVGFESYQTAKTHTPLMLQGVNYYDVSDEANYLKLYRHLTGQPEVQKPPLGQRRVLPTSGTAGTPAENAPNSAITSSVAGEAANKPNLNSVAMITPAQLRRLMTERLNRTDVATLWFDLFATTLDNDLPGRSLAESVIELVARAGQRGKAKALADELEHSYPHVLEEKADPR